MKESEIGSSDVMLPFFLSVTGQGMGGTLTAVASVVDLAVANDVTDSALVYFLTADIFICLCIVIYLLLLPKLAYSRSISAMLHVCDK